MKSQSREDILSRIRIGLLEGEIQTINDVKDGFQSIYHPATDDIEIEFVNNFIDSKGKFVFCASLSEALEQIVALVKIRSWKKIYCSFKELLADDQDSDLKLYFTNNLENCDACITLCENLIARTGSILMSVNDLNGRSASIYAPVHICIAYTNQIVYSIYDGLERMKNSYGQNLPSLMYLATGPSRTADIEKTLVEGIHGPGEVFCFLVEHQ